MARWLIFAVLGAFSAASPAATVDVTVTGNSFSPREVRIQAGDTVRWSNRTGVAHDVVADDGSFNSGISSNFTFQRTFNSAGEFGYYCSLHGSSGGVGMAGRVIVQGGTPAPTAPPIAPYVAGSWFNPATSGQGLLVEATTGSSVFGMAWFTWTPTGALDWFIGSGTYSGNQVDLTVFHFTGGRFNDPAPVQGTEAGTARFILKTCTTADFQYNLSNPPRGSGTIPLQKLLPAGAGCTDPATSATPQR